MAKPKEDFSLKQTRPNISGTKSTSSPMNRHDLVEQMQFIYVKILKAKDLPNICDPYVELILGSYKGTTKFFEKKSDPEWNQAFAFKKERIQASVLELLVRDKADGSSEMIGKIEFNISDIPMRVQPDSPLAPQWYRLEDKNGVKLRGGELMVAVWMGTQADDAFSDALHSDATTSVSDAYTRSKIYHSPQLWYLRVNVIQAQDLVLRDTNRKNPEIFVKAILGNLVLRSRVSHNKNVNPMWNEDIMIVVAEPFEGPLVLSVEDKLQPNKEESMTLGRVVIPLKNTMKRVDNAPASPKWYNLERPELGKNEQEEVKFSSKLNLRISLDGGYHVLDEATYYSSDLRSTAKPLWKPVIGLLELGILNATGLPVMKQKEKRTDAYSVAKYGSKWVRTRTVLDSLTPQWNQQFSWDVYDLCTVLTIGVFDNGHLEDGIVAGKGLHQRIGKVRIRLSTLESNRIYTHSYPLVVLYPSGVKKMGEIQLALRFYCASLIDMLQTYSLPLLPKMHYISPLTVYQLDSLRHQASLITSLRLSRAEPPLKKEVVDFMLDVGSNVWSMRKAKANYERVLELFSGILAFLKWFEQIRHWTNPATTIAIHVLLLLMVFFPALILPTIFLCLFLAGIWHYPKRPRYPPHHDTKLSGAETANVEELDEEFDSFPSRKTGEVLRRRYDRLRSIAGRIQVVLGDLATQGERVKSLLSWRDSRATFIFVCFSMIAGLVTYITPFRDLVILSGLYVLRHPRLRGFPSLAQNFLRRMPGRTDSMF
ncbi:Multiple C2 and transmembrane domain-containing protein 1 [Morella rubra]|uniref:Multiple C2 and transmembrane domain-containing protein 1 n=1 Tax=Morella rubra TaxID=262757 RepID=A0A6A1WLY4_9ROSI|nr:Multiple C2 and transmembrane domain-containing protein 1 [Morella rubra]